MFIVSSVKIGSPQLNAPFLHVATKTTRKVCVCGYLNSDISVELRDVKMQ